MALLFTTEIIARLLLSIVAAVLVLRFVTLAVTGSPASWVSTIIAAIVVPVLTIFALPSIAVFLMQIAAPLRSGLLVVIGVYAAITVLMAILLSLILRTEGRGESPGFGPCLIIAIVSNVVLQAISYVIDVVL